MKIHLVLLLIFTLFLTFRIHFVPSSSMEPVVPENSIIISIINPAFMKNSIMDFIKSNKKYVKKARKINKKIYNKNGVVLFYMPKNIDSNAVGINVVKRIAAISGDTIFYDGETYHTFNPIWKGDQIIKLNVPYRGMSIELDTSSCRLWKPHIERDLNFNEVDCTTLSRSINYTFQNDFFFVQGDSPSSIDSRTWGAIPQSHLRGRVLLNISNHGVQRVK